MQITLAAKLMANSIPNSLPRQPAPYIIAHTQEEDYEVVDVEIKFKNQSIIKTSGKQAIEQKPSSGNFIS